MNLNFEFWWQYVAYHGYVAASIIMGLAAWYGFIIMPPKPYNIAAGVGTLTRLFLHWSYDLDRRYYNPKLSKVAKCVALLMFVILVSPLWLF
ncbi:MAG: hypothetical protein V4467_00375 [Patescibacteria group bacterium]